MDLLAKKVDMIGRFILGLLIYFVTFIIFLIIMLGTYNFFHVDDLGVPLISSLVVGVYINNKLLHIVKNKFIKYFLLVIQAIVAYIGTGFFLYSLFFSFLAFFRPF